MLDNTQTFQINDARQLPIVISNAQQLKVFEEILNKTYSIKTKQLSEEIDINTVETQLNEIQEKLDKKVIELYKLEN